jgi:uncharacterized protein (DUF433 family)
VPTIQALDIYRGSRPADLALYARAEAAQYLRLPAATVRAWVVGRPDHTKKGGRPSSSVIQPADPQTPLLSFQNLVELHVLRSIRPVHAVQLKAVRRAVKYLKEQLHSEHPLLDRELLTAGKDLFIEQYGELVTISQDGQRALKRVRAMYLDRIDRDHHGIPIRLYPFTRSRIEQSPRVIAIDPKIRFGKPCIAGTRIPTDIIAERYEAGDSMALLAEDYGRPPQEIEEVVRYESRSAC